VLEAGRARGRPALFNEDEVKRAGQTGRSSSAGGRKTRAHNCKEKIGWPPEVVDDKVTCAAHSATSPVEPSGKKELV